MTHAPSRTTLSAIAVRRLCRCVLARPSQYPPNDSSIDHAAEVLDFGQHGGRLCGVVLGAGLAYGLNFGLVTWVAGARLSVLVVAAGAVGLWLIGLVLLLRPRLTAWLQVTDIAYRAGLTPVAHRPWLE